MAAPASAPRPPPAVAAQAAQPPAPRRLPRRAGRPKAACSIRCSTTRCCCPAPACWWRLLAGLGL
ncbi:MAG: hypothetical protein MZW92_24485 [Comamonadaceae bacterium]|nr:hypothetical protein [Comamonadaceae bacterium]